MSCALRGRDRLELADDAADLGFGDSQDGGNLADGFALVLEFLDVGALDFAGFLAAVAEVFRLLSEFHEVEVDVAAFVGDFVDEDVAGAVFLLAGADFELLDVTYWFLGARYAAASQGK